MQKFGIDVSRWQGDFDFEYARNENGVEFAILKAGGADDGFYQDRKFERNYAECERIGLDKGAYFFGNAFSPEDAEKEADYFLSLVRGKTFEYPLWYDVEAAMLSAENLTDCILIFLNRVKAAGYPTGLYTSESHMNTRMDIAAVSDAGHYIWSARYSETPPALNHDVKTDIWQFGGSVNYLRDTEIAGQTCDQNYCYTDFISKPETPSTETESAATYVVQPGDCLSVIASQLKVDINDLAAANDIHNIHLIYPGQILILPDARCSDDSSANSEESTAALSNVYVVQSGDTLWSIAERLFGNGSRYTQLASLNHIADPSLIFPGQEIYY